jgi:hypothetical protein
MSTVQDPYEKIRESIRNFITFRSLRITSPELFSKVLSVLDMEEKL